MTRSSAKYSLDDLDRRLVSLLRADGRAPVSKLADILGVARGTVQARIDRLLDAGALLGFTARIRDDHEDSGVRAVMMIEVEGRNTTHVINKLRGLPELYRLHTTSGKWDLVADIMVENLAEFDRILREVRVIDGIRNSETSMLLSTI